MKCIIINGQHQYYGKSTEQKPENAETGDVFYEIDIVEGVHRVFMFDADAGEWIFQFSVSAG